MNSSQSTPRAHITPPVSVSRRVAGLVAWLAVTFLAAGIGGIGSVSAPEFYNELALPEWAPPAGVFGPVWGALYALMGVAAWLVWRKGGFDRSGGALPLYVVQLGLNALWSWLFFAWRLGAWAFAEILLLWALVAATLAFFWRVRPLAGMLMLPYLAWLTFAAALCRAIWMMNPDKLG